MSIPDPISGYHTEAGSGERGAWSMEQKAETVSRRNGETV